MDLTDFEDENYEGLVEKFIEKHKNQWQEFILEEYNNREVKNE